MERLEIPDWLADLIATESGDIDIERARRRLASYGVSEMFAVGDETRPVGVGCRVTGVEHWVEVWYHQWTAPVSTALSELVQAMSLYDQLSRLHSAMQDMELVGVAARALAQLRDESGGWRARRQRRRLASLGMVDSVLEVGIVTMYSRPFTGYARIGDRWLPTDEDDRILHEWLILNRNKVYVHYDRTDERTLVNINETPDGSGPAVFAEMRSSIPTEVLLAVADLCERQYGRFWDETGRLKYEMAMQRPPES